MKASLLMAQNQHFVKSSPRKRTWISLAQTKNVHNLSSMLTSWGPTGTFPLEMGAGASLWCQISRVGTAIEP